MKYLSLCGVLPLMPFMIQPGTPAIDGPTRTSTIVVKQTEMKDDKTTFEMKVRKDDVLAVKLEWKATGYDWTIKKNDNAALKPEGDGKPRTERGENRPGASEFRVYQFKVLKAGAIELELARPFGERDPRIAIIKVELEKDK